jgi:hypothetical protein
VRQIWVSALSRSFKFSWSDDIGGFALEGEGLNATLERLVQQQLQG